MVEHDPDGHGAGGAEIGLLPGVGVGVGVPAPQSDSGAEIPRIDAQPVLLDSAGPDGHPKTRSSVSPPTVVEFGTPAQVA